MDTLSPNHPILPRAAAAASEHASRIAPVVVLLGARQTGKTTLLETLPLLKGRPYLTLDDFDQCSQAEENPPADQISQALLEQHGTGPFLTGESETRGAHLENLVLTDLLAWCDLQTSRPEVLYWRTAPG